MAGYDPKKAELFNKLKQQGLTEDQAWTQAGLTDNDIALYVINDSPYNNDGTKNTNRGQMGPLIVGSGTQTIPYTAAEKAESDAYNASLDDTKNVERVAYPVKADSQPSTATPITYTTTSTEQVSGGGSTTVISGQPKANDTSLALQSRSDAKTAELKQYLADNPRNANATPEEQAARRAKITELSNERNQLASQAEEAKTPGNPTVTTTPNTTTDTSTTTFSQSSTNSDVETTEGPDPALNEVPTLDNTQVQNAAPEPVFVQAQTVTNVDITAPVDAPAEVVIDEPQNQPLLTPEQSIAQAQTVPAEQDPAAAAADFNANTNANVQEAIGVQAPAPVDPAQNPGAAGPFGGAAFNNAAARDPAAVAAATQAAQEAQTKQEAAAQAEFQSPASGDWRVRLRLAPDATYLYKDKTNSLLAPLAASKGVVFPYMPTIQTAYNANYDSTDLTHSNYRGQFYKSSYVSDIQITGIFTAQDTAEANYLLAVIHFFRSVTKMFYGARDPLRGAPPPLVYLIGLGQYQFNNQPCVVKTFNYSMPNDCDYIRTKPNNYNVNLGDRQTKTQTGGNPIAAVIDRLRNAGLKKGALPNVPAQSLLDLQSVYNIDNSTYVPTKCEIQITLMPIQTRDQQSKLFNMQDYASGKLLKGGFW
jgi:chemotaxis protein histidine kinase CheA